MHDYYRPGVEPILAVGAAYGRTGSCCLPEHDSYRLSADLSLPLERPVCALCLAAYRHIIPIDLVQNLSLPLERPTSTLILDTCGRMVPINLMQTYPYRRYGLLEHLHLLPAGA